MAEQQSEPSAGSVRKAQHKKRQQRLIIATLAVIVVGIGAWQAYEYINSAPDRAKVDLEEGILLMRPGSYGDAIPHFDAAIAIDPDSFEAYYQRAQANVQLGNFDIALEDYQRVIAMDPNRVEAHTAMADIFRKNGDNDRALEAFSASLKLAPTADAFNQRGMTYAALGRHNEAIDDFTEAIVLRRDSPYVYLARANSRRAIGDADGAREDEAAAQSFIRTVN